jgi:spermidine/putrescine transport system permease protein
LTSQLLRNPTFRAWALTLPVLLTVGVFLAAALGSTIVVSFWRQVYLDLVPAFTFENYLQVYVNPQYVPLFFRSLIIAACTTTLTLAIAYPIAYYLAFYSGRQRGIWIILITIPFWSSYLLRVFAWKLILGFNGMINSGLKFVGLIDESLSFLVYNPIAIVITLVHAWLPFAILPLFVSLEKIDRSYLEAATDLGDTSIARLLRIVLPLSLPGIIAASLMIFVPTVGDYVTPLMVGGPDGMMIANAISANFGKSNNWPLGSALAMSSMVIVGCLSLLYLFLGRKFTERFA